MQRVDETDLEIERLRLLEVSMLVVPIAQVQAHWYVRWDLVDAAGKTLQDFPERARTFEEADQALGMEARVTLYAGRPIPLASLAPPAQVERNQLVTLVFRQGGLEIRAEGRALARGAPDETVRVMNLASRNTLSGRVAGPGLVFVP